MIDSSGLKACQEALMHLGNDTILKDVNPKSPIIEERKFGMIYENARKSFLTLYPWSFACRTINIEGCECQIGVPSDCLYVVSIRDCRQREIEWCRKADDLIELKGMASRFVYIYDMENVDKWDFVARQAFVYYLAKELTLSFKSKSTEAQWFESKYMEVMKQAKLVDAKQSHSSKSVWGANDYVEDMEAEDVEVSF